MSSSSERNDCGLAGEAVPAYEMNVPVKHATLRFYGPKYALILLLITRLGAAAHSEHSDSSL